MSDILYFTLILVLSPTQVDVIYNKVTWKEYEKFEIGTIERKSYTNSESGLKEIMLDSKKFSGSNTTMGVNIDLAENNLGFMKVVGIDATKEDVTSYARKKNISPVTDTVFVMFAHKKVLNNLGR